MLVQSIPALELHLALNDGIHENGRVLVHVAILVDEYRDSAVGKACRRKSILDDPVTDLVQVLVWSGAPAKPAVVGDVHHELGSCTDGFTHQVPKDGVVANEGRPQEGSVHRSFLAGNKIAFAQVYVVQDWEDVVKGNAFTEWNQVFFDVAPGKAVVAWRK